MAAVSILTSEDSSGANDEDDDNDDTSPSSSSTTTAAVVTDAASATAAGPESWERFYRTHSGKDGAKGHRVQAFKDRHYLRREFAELMPQSVRDDPKAWTPPLDPAALPPPNPNSSEAKVVLELGCGVGNSAFPLMRANVDLFVHACDCSPTAIAALTSNPEYDPRRCDAFVADLSGGEAPLRNKIGDESIDAVTGVFFFSALDEEAFARVARECHRVLRPGGVVLFRDYADDDVKNGGGGGDDDDDDDEAEDEGRGGEIEGRSSGENEEDTGSMPSGGERGNDEVGSSGGTGEAGGAGGAGTGGGGGGGGGAPTTTVSFKPGEKVGRDTYVRGDGTLAVFTDEAAVKTSFERAGLEGECWRVTHEIVNRKLDVKITRSFVQGRFFKKQQQKFM